MSIFLKGAKAIAAYMAGGVGFFIAFFGVAFFNYTKAGFFVLAISLIIGGVVLTFKFIVFDRPLE